MRVHVLRSSIWLEFWRAERGQDLVEHSLVAGFVAVAGGAAFPPIASSVSSIFSKAISVLDKFS